MKAIKKILHSIVVAFCTWIGIHLAQKSIETVTNADKRRTLKQKISRIKDILFEKE